MYDIILSKTIFRSNLKGEMYTGRMNVMFSDWSLLQQSEQLIDKRVMCPFVSFRALLHSIVLTFLIISLFNMNWVKDVSQTNTTAFSITCKLKTSVKNFIGPIINWIKQELILRQRCLQIHDVGLFYFILCLIFTIYYYYLIFKNSMTK